MGRLLPNRFLDLVAARSVQSRNKTTLGGQPWASRLRGERVQGVVEDRAHRVVVEPLGEDGVGVEL